LAYSSFVPSLRYKELIAKGEKAGERAKEISDEIRTLQKEKKDIEKLRAERSAKTNKEIANNKAESDAVETALRVLKEAFGVGESEGAGGSLLQTSVTAQGKAATADDAKMSLEEAAQAFEDDGRLNS